MAHRVALRAQHPRSTWLTVLPMLLTVLLVAVWAEGQDYYELLGVSREATTKEIRRAFKQLALTMHPDKNPVSYMDKPQSRNTKK